MSNRPVAKLVFKAKGENAKNVGAIWQRDTEYGSLVSLSPQLEHDEYSDITLHEALKQVAQGKGFFNLQVYTTIERNVKTKEEREAGGDESW